MVRIRERLESLTEFWPPMYRKSRDGSIANWFLRGFEVNTSSLNLTPPGAVHYERRAGVRHGYWYGLPVYWRVVWRFEMAWRRRHAKTMPPIGGGQETINRREAIAALTALPAVSRVTVARANPEDVVVVEFDDHVPDSRLLQIRERVEQVFPNRKVLVLGPSTRLKLVQG